LSAQFYHFGSDFIQVGFLSSSGFWQSFNKVIEGKPEAPTMVIKSNWKEKRYAEKEGENCFIVGANNANACDVRD
jgi:hypothetical protein